MSRKISLFADYRQRENSLTNYCGLILKILYKENPSSFEEVLTALVSSDISLTIGPIFTQQEKQETSIPDLAIFQKPFSIFFETKLRDWFYSDQIVRHLKGFSEIGGLKILFLLSNFETENYEERFSEVQKQARKQDIILQAISFEDFVGTIENVKMSESFADMFDEFKTYLDRNGLLPKWKGLLDVVSCRGTLEEIEYGVYMCPDTGGAYSHRRAKFFGPYANKKVSKIYEIDAIVIVDVNLSNPSIKWKNNPDIEDEILLEKAISAIQNWDWRIDENAETPLQVFILSNGAETNFLKTSSGGMLQSKKYFWNIANDCKTSIELAEKLKKRTWE